MTIQQYCIRGEWLRVETLRATARALLGICLVTTFLLVAPDPGFAEEPPPEIGPALATPAIPPMVTDDAVVVIDGVELFPLLGIPAFPAKLRVSDVVSRIKAAAKDPTIDAASIRAVAAEGGINIFAGETRLLTLVELDAENFGVPLPILGGVVTRQIAQAITSYRADRKPEVLRRHALAAASIVAGASLLIWLVLRVHRWIDERLARSIRERAKAAEKQSLGVIRALQIETAIRTLVKGLAFVLSFAIFYLSINAALNLFPWTRETAVVLWSVFFDPLTAVAISILEYLPNLVFLAIVIVAARFVLSATHVFFNRIERRQIRLTNFEPEWAQSTYRIVRLLILAFAVVIAYPYLPGARSEALKGVSLLLGVMLSIGSSSVIANIIAGYSMTYRSAFRKGDRIQVGDVVGEVLESKVLATRIRTPRNEEVVVPNSVILSSSLVNYSSLAAKRGLIIQAVVGIGYEVPWRQVEAMLILAANQTIDVEADPPPFVLQTALGDFAVSYTLNVVTRNAHRMLELRSDLHRNIQDVFNEHGVAIMTPAYRADPPVPKVVPRDRWFESPAKPPPEETAAPPSDEPAW